jgi:hypothetical protein
MRAERAGEVADLVVAVSRGIETSGPRSRSAARRRAARRGGAAAALASRNAIATARPRRRRRGEQRLADLVGGVADLGQPAPLDDRAVTTPRR